MKLLFHVFEKSARVGNKNNQVDFNLLDIWFHLPCVPMASIAEMQGTTPHNTAHTLFLKPFKNTFVLSLKHYTETPKIKSLLTAQ